MLQVSTIFLEVVVLLDNFFLFEDFDNALYNIIYKYGHFLSMLNDVGYLDWITSITILI